MHHWPLFPTSSSIATNDQSIYFALALEKKTWLYKQLSKKKKKKSRKGDEKMH